MNVLSLDNVSRHFGSIKALSNISMDVAEGELRAVIGPNGAGKTTLFNLISGYYAPSSGTMSFEGQRLQGISPEKLVRRGIIRTFQITEVFLEQTVHENLRIAVEAAEGMSFKVWLSGAQKRALQDRVMELSEMMGLQGRLHEVVGEMPHGDQRVVEVALALARKPRLLLLDEPTAGMGEEETQRMTELIQRLHEQEKMTMLFIEHDMKIIFDVADRITVLDNGNFLAEGTPEEISGNAAVQTAYLGEAA